MVKKKAAEKGEPKGIAKCDTLNEVSPNHDEVITSVAQSSPENVSIKSMIRVIRGQQVMLDFDLAFLYGVETKALNQAVKRNTNRFPEDFMFKLTKSELEILRSQIVTSNPIERHQNTNWKSQIMTSNLNNNHGSDFLMSQNATSSFAKMGLRRPPYAFTRNGVAMLSSVLRSQTAVGYRSGDKNQLDWIKEHLMYNIRASVNRHGYRNGIIDENVVSARYLILYEINDKEKRNYHIYRIDSWKTRSTEWMANNGYEKPNGPYIVYSLLEETNFEQANVNAMLNIGLYNEIAFRKTKGVEVSEEWLCDAWQGSPVFLTGRQINDYALASHRDTKKALVVVNISDPDLSNLGKGYSSAMFVAPRTPQAIKDFTSAGYIVYSNKQTHKVYRVQGDASVSIEAPNGYLPRRYAEPIKEMYPDRKERDKVPSDFHLSISTDSSEAHIELNQSKINKVPEGLSGYDSRVVKIGKLME